MQAIDIKTVEYRVCVPVTLSTLPEEWHELARSAAAQGVKRDVPKHYPGWHVVGRGPDKFSYYMTPEEAIEAGAIDGEAALWWTENYTPHELGIGHLAYSLTLAPTEAA